jgi:hypothetical protein
MQRWRIFEYTKIHVVTWGAESGGFRPIDTDLLAGFNGVLQETSFESGGDPCLGY